MIRSLCQHHPVAVLDVDHTRIKPTCPVTFLVSPDKVPIRGVLAALGSHVILPDWATPAQDNINLHDDHK